MLFIDEIHRIAKPAEELLYSAMEDFRVDVVVGKGPGATAIPLDVEPFTLVGATTRSGPADRADAGPVRLRRRTSTSTRRPSWRCCCTARRGSSGVPITDGGRGGDRRPVPGHAADRQPAAAPGPRLRRGAGRRRGRPPRPPGPRCSVYDVDELGLDRLDRAVLTALVDSFGGGPVGLSTLAVAVGEQPDTVEEVCEPFLVRAGLLARTPRGRVATEAAWRHLGRTPPNGTFGAGAAAVPDLFSADCQADAVIRS